MKHLPLILLIVLASFSCINRDHPILPRDNPYDSGGTNYLNNGIPTINGRTDSVWFHYDHDSGFGSVRLFYTADDPNLPSDTVSVELYYGSSGGELGALLPENDSIAIMTGLVPEKEYACSLHVSDSLGSFSDTVFLFTPPGLLPPLPPEPSITSGESSVTLTWKIVENADSYRIYSSEQYDGQFTPSDTLVTEKSIDPGTPLSVSYELNETDVRYFIVSSVNEYGESRSNDTLLGKIYTIDVAVPDIESVSKGTYIDHITIEWSTEDAAIDSFELYRSLDSAENYHIIAKVEAVSGDNMFNDSVTTSRVYYYRIAAIDEEGRSSRLSSHDFGFLRGTFEAPELSVESHPDHIALTWNRIEGAESYKVYRSPESCDDGMELRAGTMHNSFNDSVTAVKPYFYTVTSVDDNGYESAKSECVIATLGILPAPSGIQVSNALHDGVISLKWDPLPGAVSYAVFRSSVACPEAVDPYVTTKKTEFQDTVGKAKTFYYRIAGIDNTGRTGTASMCYIGSVQRLSSPEDLKVTDGTFLDRIGLSWKKLDGAESYNIYRSTGSCWGSDRKVIANTTDTEYMDTVPTNAIYFYTVTGIDKGDIEGSASSCVDGRVKIFLPPDSVRASVAEHADAIRISWRGVDGADGYVIYRNTNSSSASAAVLDSVASLVYYDSVSSSNTYYYWVAAYNKLGVGILSIHASGRIATPPVLRVSRFTSSVSLSWQFSGTATGYLIYRDIDSTNLIVIDSTTSTTYSDYPPDFNGYTYLVAARLPNGELSKSNTVLGYKLLPAPSGLTASDKAEGVLLTWNTTTGITEYEIYRSTSTSNFTLFREVEDTTFFDTLQTNTRYYYRVAGKNDVQHSSTSMYVTGGRAQTPLTPSSVRTASMREGIRVAWSLSTSSSTPDGFIIYRSTASDGTYSIIDSTDALFFIDPVPDSSIYYYRIAAYNFSGISNMSSVASGRRLPPSPPTGISVSRASYASCIMITWRISDTAITGYNIYRYNRSERTFEKIGTTVDSVYIDSTPVPNERIYYRISSLDDMLEGSQSSSNSGMRLGPPDSVSASSLTYGIRVTWSSIVYDVAMYYIYRSDSARGTYTLIDSTTADRYIDSNDLAGNNYYRIKARNLETTGFSEPSAGMQRAYPPEPASVAATQGEDDSAVTVSWSSSIGATGYRVYRSASDSFATGIELIATTDTTVLIDTVPSDSFYYYRVKAYNQAGESSMSSSTARGYRIPGVVPATPLELDTIHSTSHIVLTWSMPSQTISYDGFRIYRAEEDDDEFTVVDSTSELHYADSPPESFPTVYQYRVTAYNLKGESEPTEAVTGTRE